MLKHLVFFLVIHWVEEPYFFNHYWRFANFRMLNLLIRNIIWKHKNWIQIIDWQGWAFSTEPIFHQNFLNALFKGQIKLLIDRIYTFNIKKMIFFTIWSADRNFRILTIKISRLSTHKAKQVFTFFLIEWFQLILNFVNHSVNYFMNVCLQLFILLLFRY